MSKWSTFNGSNVYLSRNLVAPEIFDTLHDALNHHNATLYLCSDSSRNGPHDFHVISSNRHEKFEDLRKKGCRLLGPHCVLSCAKERRPLPTRGYTCCLAMDGDKVLASGFEADEKMEIEKMVTAMGGVLHAKASSDVSFVIVKNVLAAKYKWSINVQKPTVTLSWLHQCWKEHHLVPHEPYRVLPFSGLTICVTRVPAAERKEMEKLVLLNGGKYSGELTRKCTHLVSDAPEGDKYKVAKRWGNILTVTRKWFDQSVARRACLNEESYPVQGSSVPQSSGARTCLSEQYSQDKGMGGSHFVPSPAESNLEPCSRLDQDFEAILSQGVSTISSETLVCRNEEPKSDTKLDGCVANDSQSEDNDLYLEDCRILLRGFDALEMRKLVNMIRRGGGSRYMAMNEKLTHVVVGSLSEIDKREVRGLAAVGVINVVRSAWLEDCDREKKEVPVLREHIAHDLLRPKDSLCQNRGVAVDIASIKQKKVSTVHSLFADGHVRGAANSGAGISLQKHNETEVIPTVNSSTVTAVNTDARSQPNTLNIQEKHRQIVQPDKKSSVFKGKVFCFSSSFPQDRRAEIIEWVNEGGGWLVDCKAQKKVHFIIECHGVVTAPIETSGVTSVSSHWICSCYQDGCLLDVDSHILYSPLPCQVPFPGFEKFRFCSSQYNDKDKSLLRNLCFVLGAKFSDKLTKRVTHLLCEFTSGPKYEAASKWGLQAIRCEWIYECVKQNKIISLDPFSPRVATSQDHEAGLCTLTQHPTQAEKMVASQFTHQSKGLRNINAQASTSGGCREYENINSDRLKRARTLGDEREKHPQFSELNQNDTLSRMTSDGENKTVKRTVGISDGENKSEKRTVGVSDDVPDIAAAIVDLLEQTSKSLGRNTSDENLVSPDCSMPVQDHVSPHPAFGLPGRWIHSSDRKDVKCNPPEDANMGIYDSFSETQTESQVVGYEEDLSGRQMIIDRVRTQSSLI